MHTKSARTVNNQKIDSLPVALCARGTERHVEVWRSGMDGLSIRTFLLLSSALELALQMRKSNLDAMIAECLVFSQ